MYQLNQNHCCIIGHWINSSQCSCKVVWKIIHVFYNKYSLSQSKYPVPYLELLKFYLLPLDARSLLLLDGNARVIESNPTICTFILKPLASGNVSGCMVIVLLWMLLRSWLGPGVISNYFYYLIYFFLSCAILHLCRITFVPYHICTISYLCYPQMLHILRMLNMTRYFFCVLFI